MKCYKAGWTWGVCLAFLGVYDLWAIPNGHESASGAFVRLFTGTKTRIPSRVFLVILLKHLCAPNVAPQVDPFRAVARKLRKDLIVINDRMAQD